MELTTNHPQSKYGIPVLLIDGVAYGAFEQSKPSGYLAYDLVHDSETFDAELVDKFLRSAPDPYFNF